ncbi:hypothetical protein OAN83_03420 [Alphaproteobacteria bacterium]|nr:hypothetical protein [Alphaproteobacteria bacterium]
MKVPTYRQQTAVTEKTGATMFSVQANPGALSAGLRAAGEFVSAAEKLAVDYYANEQKIKRQSELDDAEFELKQELQQLEQQQTTRTPNDVLYDQPNKGTQGFASLGQQKINNILANIDDKRVRRAFQKNARDSLNTFTINVNQGARNRLIDQNKANGFRKADELMDDIVMGNQAQRTIANEKLFGDPSKNIVGHYEQMAADGYIKESEAAKLSRAAFVSVRDRAQKADAAILESNTNKRVNIAGDVRNRTVQERTTAYTDLVADINKAVTNNTITADEGEKRKRAAADDTVRQTFLGVMTEAPSAEAVVLQIAQGDIQDPVMQSVINQMDAGDQVKLISDMFTLGNKIDTERREKEEADEEAADEENKKNFQTIINVDTADAEAMTAAKALHKELLKDNFYTASERNAAEKRLGLQKTTAGTDIKTSKDAVRALNKADNDNTLTVALVDTFADKLSTTDYNAYFKRAITEGKEGRTAAKGLIGSRLRYNEFKDSNNALGDASDAMYQQSMFELDDWLNTVGEGAGATYQETVKKAREIIAANDVEYKQMMGEALTSYILGQQRTMPGLPSDIEAAKVFLQQRLQSDPQNPLTLGVVQTIKSYEKLLRD